MTDVKSVQPLPAGKRPPRVLAICSSGGHWAELRRIKDAWDGCAVTYVTTSATLARDLEDDPQAPGKSAPRFVSIVDINRWSPALEKARVVLQIALVLLRSRPDVIVSTGALPGYIAIRLGRLMGARRIWLESIANVEEPSTSGLRASAHCNLWLTQWEHQTQDPKTLGLACTPTYAGKVL